MFAFVFDRRVAIVLCLLFVLVFAVPVWAQEVPPVDDPGGALLTSDEASRILEDSLESIVAGGGVGAFVYLFVQLFKFVPRLKNVSATDLSLVTALVLVIAGTAANKTGYGAIFDDSARFAELLLPPIISILTAVFTAGAGYNMAQRVGASPASFLGKQRTVPGAVATNNHLRVMPPVEIPQP